MAISLETATRLSTDLVRIMKLFQSMKQHAPRLHPGVEAAAYPVLFSLSEGPRRVSVLAECVHSDVSTVSRQVGSLVTYGLIAKVPDPDDGRASTLSLSAEGNALVERLKAGRGEWFRQMLHDWEPDDAEAFNAYLERFATSFEASKDMLKQLHAPSTDTSATGAPATAPTRKEQ